MRLLAAAFTYRFSEGESLALSADCTPRAWDSIGHMDLMSGMEETYGINISTLDVLDFSSYEKGKEILAKYGVEL